MRGRSLLVTRPARLAGPAAAAERTLAQPTAFALELDRKLRAEGCFSPYGLSPALATTWGAHAETAQELAIALQLADHAEAQLGFEALDTRQLGQDRPGCPSPLLLSPFTTQPSTTLTKTGRGAPVEQASLAGDASRVRCISEAP